MNPKLCAYRGAPATTRDHVVARAFFGSPAPQNPVIVPACQPCNSGRGDGNPRHLSLDEEYARTVFCANYGSEKHPTVKRLLANEIPRSYLGNPRFLKMMMEKTDPRPVELPNGLVLTNAVSMEVDMNRIYRVIRKVVRGLYYAGAGRPLAKDQPISIGALMKADVLRDSIALLGRIRNHTPQWILVGDAFRWRAATTTPVSDECFMILAFYDRIAFWADTVRRDASGQMIDAGTW